MKKSLFGYNVKTVDSQMEILTNQNTSLKQRNDFLEEENKSLQNQLIEEQDKAIDPEQYAALQNELSQMADEMAQLKIAASEAKKEALEAREEAKRAKEEAELAKKSYLSGPKEEEKKEVPEVSLGVFNDMLIKACNDVSNTKAMARGQIEGVMETYTGHWSDSQIELMRMIARLDEMRLQARESYMEAERKVLAQLDELGARTEEINTWLGKMHAEKLEFQKGAEALVKQLED